VAGTVSTGGLAALVAKMSFKKSKTKIDAGEKTSNANERSSENVNTHSR
jgi:hypothetical protein